MEKRCIIITAYLEGIISDLVDISDNDHVICADGGLDIALSQHISPNVVIGDFDSSHLDYAIPKSIKMITVPKEKDQTDTSLCLDYALHNNFANVLVIGGIGGRLDHTLANIQNIFHFAQKGLNIIMLDGNNIVMGLINSSILIPKKSNYKISLFSQSDFCFGVNTTGLAYPLNNATLSSRFPLGVSNEFLAEDAFIEVESGQLLIILSKDN